MLRRRNSRRARSCAAARAALLFMMSRAIIKVIANAATRMIPLAVLVIYHFQKIHGTVIACLTFNDFSAARRVPRQAARPYR